MSETQNGYNETQYGYNKTEDGYSDDLQNQQYILKLVICIAYGILCVVGTLGNLCVIIMITHIFLTQINKAIRRRSAASGQTPTNSIRHVFVYVMALSVVDLMVALHLPFLIVDTWSRQWIFGQFMCKLYLTGECLNKTASTFILTVLSWDRYMAVCQPIASLRYRKGSVAMLIVLGCVILAAIVLLPIQFYAGQHIVYTFNETIGNQSTIIPHYKCSFNPGAWFFWMTFIVGFFLPGLLMIIFYSNVVWKLHASSRAVAKWNVQLHTAHHPRIRQVSTRILAVIVFYFVCWSPHWLLNMLLSLEWLVVAVDRYWTVLLFYTAHLLVCCNSAINPIFYAVLNKELLTQHATAMEKRRQSWYNATAVAMDFFGRHGSRFVSEQVRVSFSRRGTGGMRENDKPQTIDIEEVEEEKVNLRKKRDYRSSSLSDILRIDSAESNIAQWV